MGQNLSAAGTGLFTTRNINILLSTESKIVKFKASSVTVTSKP